MSKYILICLYNENVVKRIVKENKHEKFRRLAKLRGNRILKDIQLLSNLSNSNNYEYTEEEVRILFSTIEEELRAAKYSFIKKRSREIKL